MAGQLINMTIEASRSNTILSIFVRCIFVIGSTLYIAYSFGSAKDDDTKELDLSMHLDLSIL